MRIYIPSRGRPEAQKTADALKEAGVRYTIVVAKDDPTIDQYRKLHGDCLRVMDVDTLCEKRARIFERAAEDDVRFAMMDDDLLFYARQPDGKFLKATQKQIRHMCATIDDTLRNCGQCGLVDKFMSHTQPRGWKEGGRYNQVLGYNTELIKRNAKLLGVEMPNFRLPLNQEHDMHLQLLDIGLPPRLLCEFSKDAKYYAEGGLSKFRTVEMEKKAFRLLEKTWPDYVTLRETKHSISGIAATFNWKRAMEHCKDVDKKIAKKLMGTK